MKLREGDQPLPVRNQEVDCQETLMRRLKADIPVRRQVGIERYGTGLQPFNGREVARDAYEEWLDLGVYIEQWRRERRELVTFLKSIATYAPEGMDALQDRARFLLKGMGEDDP